MITKNIILIFLLSVILISCKQQTVTLEELEDKQNLYYLKSTGKLFTGNVESYLYKIGYIKKGKREGEWIEYQDNGQPWHKGNYKDGKRNGYWQGFHKDGAVRWEGNYIKGKEEGIFSYYNEKYKLWATQIFENGKLVTKKPHEQGLDCKVTYINSDKKIRIKNRYSYWFYNATPKLISANYDIDLDLFYSCPSHDKCNNFYAPLNRKFNQSINEIRIRDIIKNNNFNYNYMYQLNINRKNLSFDIFIYDANIPPVSGITENTPYTEIKGTGICSKINNYSMLKKIEQSLLNQLISNFKKNNI